MLPINTSTEVQGLLYKDKKPFRGRSTKNGHIRVQVPYLVVSMFGTNYYGENAKGILDVIWNAEALLTHTLEKPDKYDLETRLIQAPFSPITLTYLNLPKVRREYKLSLRSLEDLTGFSWQIRGKTQQAYPVEFTLDFMDESRLRDYANDIVDCFEDCISQPEPATRIAPCVILSYSVRSTDYFPLPSPGKSPLMGIELELEEVNESKLMKVHEALGNHCIFKRDGSLSQGIEIVSRPATRKEHEEEYAKFFACDHNLKAKSNCGIHIHLDRRGMSFLQLGKIVEFMNKDDNLVFVSRLAGRAPNTYWKIMGEKDLSWFAEIQNNQGSFTGRYSVVNLENKHTAEFRMFKSTTDKGEFFRNIEFVDALHSFTLPGQHGLSLKEQTKWETFVSWILAQKRAYPLLHSFVGA